VRRNSPSKLHRGRLPTANTRGRLVYAVGDIHGRADLLGRLMSLIDLDVAERPPAERPALVFLGDYIDRGPDSRAVVDLVLSAADERGFEVRTLMGNHEQVMVQFLADARIGPSWAEYGGLQTLASYGVTPPVLRSGAEAWEAARQALSDAIPKRHLQFFAGLEMYAAYGDYVFVHAGVRPGVAMEDQSENDLLWIRDDFLRARAPFDGVIVHGHTPSPSPFLGPNRIGIDTGAYATGVLTAIRLSEAPPAILQSRMAQAA